MGSVSPSFRRNTSKPTIQAEEWKPPRSQSSKRELVIVPDQSEFPNTFPTPGKDIWRIDVPPLTATLTKSRKCSLTLAYFIQQNLYDFCSCYVILKIKEVK